MTTSTLLSPPGSETAIADHGLIGDLQTAALVTTDGSIDWLCLPRFDSPSVFGALLDAERGGHFRIRPAGTGWTAKQMYLPDTAVLVTRFFTEAGLGQVLDFMPPAGDTATDTPGDTTVDTATDTAGDTVDAPVDVPTDDTTTVCPVTIFFTDREALVRESR